MHRIALRTCRLFSGLARDCRGVAATEFAVIVPVMLLMFFGGVYLPRFMLPSVVRTIGSYSPPGVEALQQAWLGTAPDWRHLAIMGLVSLVAGTVAARTFRWE